MIDRVFNEEVELSEAAPRTLRTVLENKFSFRMRSTHSYPCCHEATCISCVHPRILHPQSSAKLHSQLYSRLTVRRSWILETCDRSDGSTGAGCEPQQSQIAIRQATPRLHEVQPERCLPLAASSAASWAAGRTSCAPLCASWAIS